MIAIDRSRFPSDTLSTHVNFPSAVAEIQAVGALERVLAYDPPRCTYGMVEADGARCLQRFASVDGIDYGICLPRPELDLALVETAREAGAEVRERTSLEKVLWKNQRISGVIVRQADGSHAQIDCKLLVGADGRKSTTAKLVGADRPYRGSRNERGCAFWYMDDPLVGTEWRERLIQLRSGRHPRADLSRARRTACCACSWDRSGTSRSSAPTRTACGRRCSTRTPRCACAWAGPRNRTKLRSTGDNVAFFRRSSGPGWALAGDAGHFKDPIIGQGIRDAIRFGRLLGEACGPVLDDPVATDAASRALEARRDRECNASYHWGNRESRDFAVSPVVQEALVALDGKEPPRLLHMFDRIQKPHHVLNPLRGAKYVTKALLRPGVDRKAILQATRSRTCASTSDAWREELRPKFRSFQPTNSERPDYDWPPKTPGVVERAPRNGARPADETASIG